MTKLNQLQLISQLYNDSIDEMESDKDNSTNLNEQNYRIDKQVESSNLDKCAVCLSSSFKYKCPSCLIRSCSLDCFKQHKSKFDCTGLKNSLQFKRISNFDDHQLRDDFKFLDDYNRQIDGLKRQKRNIVQSLNDLPNWLQKLIYEANRRAIKLKILPAGFQRRLQNKTAFIYSTKELHWDIELIFTDLNSKQYDCKLMKKRLKLHLNRVPENKVLKEVLDQFLKPTSLIDNQNLNNLLKFYQESDEISVLIKLSFNHYIELDQQSKLNECLKYKTIIEYPTMLVILKKNLSNYNLIDEKALRGKMQAYADKSYDLMIKNGVVKRDFNNKFCNARKEQNRRRDNGQEEDNKEKNKEEDDNRLLENEYSEDSDDEEGPEEIEIKFNNCNN